MYSASYHSLKRFVVWFQVVTSDGNICSHVAHCITVSAYLLIQYFHLFRLGPYQ